VRKTGLADVRQYLTQEDGLADDLMAEKTAFPSDRLFKDDSYRLSPSYRALLDDAVAYASERVSTAKGQDRREERILRWCPASRCCADLCDL
jgi:hypothetical protein